MNVSYLQFNSDQERIAKGLVEKNLWILPWWAEEVNIVSAYSYEKDPSAQVVCRPEYRRVDITLCANFFSCEADYQERQIRHEMAHATTWPLRSFTGDLVDILDDGPLKKHMKQRLINATEAITQDLTVMLERAVEHGKILGEKTNSTNVIKEA